MPSRFRSTAISRATPTRREGSLDLLGIELALNFNLPYFATSPRDFWDRWHISLSTWLRDYLYIPLGGNRRASGGLVWRGLFAAVWRRIALVCARAPERLPASG